MKPGVAPSIVSVGSVAISRLPDGDVVVGDSAIKIGATTEIAATHISVGSDLIVVAGSTYTLSSPITSTDDRIQGLAGGGAVFEGITIASHDQTTIYGTSVSMGSGFIVIDGVTQTLPLDVAPTPGPGIGAMIASMLRFDPEFGSTDVAKTTFLNINQSASLKTTSASPASISLSEAFQGASAILEFKMCYFAAGMAACVLLTAL